MPKDAKAKRSVSTASSKSKPRSGSTTHQTATTTRRGGQTGDGVSGKKAAYKAVPSSVVASESGDTTSEMEQDWSKLIKNAQKDLEAKSRKKTEAVMKKAQKGVDEAVAAHAHLKLTHKTEMSTLYETIRTDLAECDAEMEGIMAELEQVEGQGKLLFDVCSGMIADQMQRVLEVHAGCANVIERECLDEMLHIQGLTSGLVGARWIDEMRLATGETTFEPATGNRYPGYGAGSEDGGQSGIESAVEDVHEAGTNDRSTVEDAVTTDEDN